MTSSPSNCANLQASELTLSDLALSREYRNSTPAMVFEDERKPSLFGLCRTHGVDKVEAFLSLQLMALSRFMNLKNGLTEEHIRYIVDVCLHEDPWRWFKIGDFAIIFDRIKKAYYGQFYENFNGVKFFDILNQYDGERARAIIDYRSNENHRSNLAEVSNEGIRKMMADYAEERRKETAEAERKEKETEERIKKIEEQRKFLENE